MEEVKEKQALTSIKYFSSWAEKLTKVINCRKCGRCCTAMPAGISVFEEEILPIAYYLGVRTRKVRRLLRRMECGLVLPSPCPFYKGKRCSIYPKRPRVCQYYPMISDGEGRAKPTYIKVSLSCPAGRDLCKYIQTIPKEMMNS